MQNLNFTNMPPTADSSMNIVRLSIKVEDQKEIQLHVNASWVLFVWGDRCYYNHGEHIYKNSGIYTVYIFATQLKKLVLGKCNCISLTLEECPELIALDCENNQMEELILDQAFLLQFLKCGNNPLRHLDLSHCSSLISLECNDCLLENINLPSSDTLNYIQCKNNRLGEGLKKLIAELPVYLSLRGTLDYSCNPASDQIDLSELRAKGWEP